VIYICIYIFYCVSDPSTCGGTAKWYVCCLNALAAEAMHWRAAMECKLAQERGVRRLILETDCQVLTGLWENRSYQRSEISALLTQMEDILARALKLLVYDSLAEIVIS